MMLKQIRKILKSQIINLARIRKNVDFSMVSTTEAMEHIKKAEDCLLKATSAEEFVWSEFIASIEKKKARYRQEIEQQVDIIEENSQWGDWEKVDNAVKEIKAILKEN